MKSKEWIKGVLYNLEEALDCAKETKNKDLEIDYKMQKEAYNQVLKDLEELEHYRKVKSYIERMYDNPFYTKESGYIRKWVRDDDWFALDYDIFYDYVDIFYDYEEELSISVEELETKIIFPNEEIEKEYQEQQAEKMRKYEEQRKNKPVWYGAGFNGTSGGNGNEI